MKKIISVIMCLVLVCSVFIGCAKKDTYKSDIVLITNGATIKDGGYNQSAWEGINSFAEENNMTCRYYQPVLDNGELTVENVEKYVDLSSKNGAKFIVLPGAEFAVSAYELAGSYPDVNFILVDSLPHSADTNIDSFIKNVMSISFDTLQSGFLAGYMAVLNGHTELGFFGEAKSKESAQYGAGFVQGAGFAADSLGIPVVLNWADYDSALLDYSYDFTIKACYDKIEDVEADTKEKVYTVKVENGIGSGSYKQGSNVTITANPASEGQTFDHWEVKSNTDGVKDKKVNISSKTKSSMNLLVEKCDCTITAVYKDIDGDYKTVTVMDADGKTISEKYSVKVGDGVSVKAPAAEIGLAFDKWESDADLGDTDLSCREIWVPVEKSDITLVPTYKLPDTPSINVNVVTGEGGNGESSGSGSYMPGDSVEVAAALPEEGYMFSHWENADSYGSNTGIAMANEFYWNTFFEMTDRYASVCESMYNQGVTAIFDGGNSAAQSAMTAKGNFDFDLSVISAGAENKDAYATIVKNYGEAIKDALTDFSGGSVALASCATEGIYSTFEFGDTDKKEEFDAIYQALANGEIKMPGVEGGAGYDFCKLVNEQNPYKCLTLNAWFLEGIPLV